MNKSGNRVKLLFLLLFIYVFAQFSWWAVLIIKLNNIIYANNDILSHKIWMIAGEAAVFALLLTAGFYLTYRFYKKEIELTKHQRNFMQAVTHEIKTPVTAVKLLLQTLQKHNLNPDKQALIINKAIHETDRLQQLTENVLAVTGFDENKINANLQLQNLSVLLTTLLKDLKQSIGQNHITLTNIADNLYCKFDTYGLQTIITNLYDNAIKYSPVNSEIRITALQENQTIKIEITDHAPPIPANMKHKIFEKFFRLGNEETRIARGTGLGLYIVKHWVRIMRASIEVMPQKTGNTFVLIFYV
jgi:K+-sensing histidine kinase KdpD